MSKAPTERPNFGVDPVEPTNQEYMNPIKRRRFKLHPEKTEKPMCSNRLMRGIAISSVFERASKRRRAKRRNGPVGPKTEVVGGCFIGFQWFSRGSSGIYWFLMGLRSF